MVDPDDLDDGGGGDEGAPAWMATFSDLATLLLTFFVLLLSFANMDVENFKSAMGSVKEAMGVQFIVDGDHPTMSTDPIELSDRPSGKEIPIDEMMARAAEQVRRYVAQKGLATRVEVEATPKGVVLRARDQVLFTVGSDSLRDESDPVLVLMADLFHKFKGDLSIEGHTDKTPIHSSRFRSNWELSSARAIAVMRMLSSQHGVPERRLHVAGYGSTRPLAHGDSVEAYDRNRRVEFLFEYPLVAGTQKPAKTFDFGAAAPSTSAAAAASAVPPPSAAPAVSAAPTPSPSSRPR